MKDPLLGRPIKINRTSQQMNKKILYCEITCRIRVLRMHLIRKNLVKRGVFYQLKSLFVKCYLKRSLYQYFNMLGTS